MHQHIGILEVFSGSPDQHFTRKQNVKNNSQLAQKPTPEEIFRSQSILSLCVLYAHCSSFHLYGVRVRLTEKEEQYKEFDFHNDFSFFKPTTTWALQTSRLLLAWVRTTNIIVTVWPLHTVVRKLSDIVMGLETVCGVFGFSKRPK